MKAVILAGGLGTRISEESHLRPKPMIEIGTQPIIWHIMKHYSHFGINEFVICLGYKGYQIKEYFSNYFVHTSDVTFDLKNNSVEIHENNGEDWKVTLVDTGELTSTGGRIKRVQKFLNDETFCLTYGDGLSNVNISELIAFHREMDRQATLTAIQPAGRYGAINISDKIARNFNEKPAGDGGWINGGFFVLEPEIFSQIQSDETVWENEPLRNLANLGQLAAFEHRGFWQSMDTLREKNILEEFWKSGTAPWKVWP